MLLISPAGATTFNVTSINMMTFSIMGLFSTLSKIIFSIECRYAECRYVECRDFLKVFLIVVMLNVILLSVVAPSSGANVIKLFMSKLTHSFCKLDHFTENNFLILPGFGKPGIF